MIPYADVMSDGAADFQKGSLGKSFVPSLALAFFATGMLDILASLFLVDIAATFLGSTDNAAVGTASQIIAISKAIALIFGLLNSILSVRFKHKSLLLFGSLCIIIGTLGCFLAPNFMFLQIFYPLDGAGTIIVGAMAIALIGEFLPLEKRAKAIGWVMAAGVLASAIGAPVAGFIENIAGWRSFLLWYVFPVSTAALAIAYFSIPKLKRQRPIPIVKDAYLRSFKQILLNKSATACLLGDAFISAANVWSLFASAFWRQQFLISVQIVAVIVFGVVLVYAAGSFVGGQLVNRVGRKRFVVFSYFFRGLLIPAIVFIPNFWAALLMSFFATFIGGFAMTAGRSLSLEQAPKSRGTMMSMSMVFWSLGGTIGAAAGGAALAQFNYQILGVTFGVFGVVAAFIIFLLAKDPFRPY
jgi:predicted MFS family arabinose efflux permease